ncbi:unnamed protein product, partial [Rotaria magnacalcarata]
MESHDVKMKEYNRQYREELTQLELEISKHQQHHHDASVLFRTVQTYIKHRTIQIKEETFQQINSFHGKLSRRQRSKKKQSKQLLFLNVFCKKFNFLKMKSEDLQKLVILKHQNGDYPTKIFRDLNGILSLATIKRWCGMIDETSSINLRYSPGCSRTARTKGAINKVKKKLQENKVSSRKLALELDISRQVLDVILRDDLGCRPYKYLVVPALTEEHKEKNKTFANWIRTNFRKQETVKILFSDEK